MALITWSDSYSIKIPTMDNQHKKLVAIINEFHDHQKQGKSKEIMEKTFNDLLDYTKTHFSEEEKFLEQNSYNQLTEHKKIHKDLIAQVTNYLNKFKSGESVVAMEINKFLQDWLINHITQEDMKYSEFIRSKEKTPAGV